MTNQKIALYSAEQMLRTVLDRSYEAPKIEIFNSTFTVTDDKKFIEIHSVQSYVDRVLQLGWVRSEWEQAASMKVTVRPRKGAEKAHYERIGSIIAVPELHTGGRNGGKWALRELVVLHEISHHLSKFSRESDCHGPAFAATFLRLVEEITTPDNAAVLRMMMYENGVKIG